ncbi:sugar ABC transporter ATP-binding protein [Solirubrobacter phytolaccae]|uniref:Sugar ABC transporter ATP-binding protein n=1 Tax=Solirubrobacter phytolaccae TaxID=1404360 RepID=A0A9X3N8U2_9ACTN|nr:sugar ABC transporter ATP-binding protein [Solirubrobacter phytolaccae]MDA0180525.1 sugar ABC transporter ATP-binding protein [Solirubrobacter phytolaccae]
MGVALADVAKSFGSTQALRGVSLEPAAGEVLAVVGANGAGKSTLNKILSGALAPDSGDVLVDGEPVRFNSPLDARQAGVETVHQHASDWTIPGLSTAENLVLDRLATGEDGPWASPRRLLPKAREVAEGLGLHLSNAALLDDVARLGVSERQLIAVARSLSQQPRLLILDEPTSALSATEAERLFTIVRSLREQGVAILYVSHRLGEVDALADRVAVMRDGLLVATFAKPFTREDVVNAMLGELAEDIARPSGHVAGKAIVEIEGARLFEHSTPFDLQLREGEVLGLTGLIGAGKSELLGALFGLRPLPEGTIALDGAAIRPTHPAEAIGHGVHLVPEDRAAQALIPGWSVRGNATLALARRFFTQIGRERTRVIDLIKDLRVRTDGPEAPIESLSGGNQQKVVVGRWLLKPARVLALDEPFRGVDLGARRDIAAKARELSSGAAIVVASADVDEVLEVADRIVVLSHGSVVQDVLAKDATRESLTLAMNA